MTTTTVSILDALRADTNQLEHGRSIGALVMCPRQAERAAAAAAKIKEKIDVAEMFCTPCRKCFRALSEGSERRFLRRSRLLPPPPLPPPPPPPPNSSSRNSKTHLYEADEDGLEGGPQDVDRGAHDDDNQEVADKGSDKETHHENPSHERRA